MENRTPDADGQIVLVFAMPGDTGAATLEVLCEWSHLGLLHDLIWIDQAGGDATGLLITSGERRDVAIAEELAARNVSAIRTVTLVAAGSEGETASAPTGAVELRRHNQFRQMAAEAAIPYAAGVIVATTVGCPVPSGIFDAGFSFNFLVAPEDRVADDRVGVPVSRESLPVQAASALAGATGLWFWSESAIVDTIRPEGGSLDPRIRLIRTYVRIADGGAVIDDVVDSCLSLSQIEGQWPLPYGLTPTALPADDAPGSVAMTADAFIRLFDIRFSPRHPPGAPSPTRMGLVEGLKLFVRTFVRVLRRIPVQWIEHKKIEVTEAVLRYFTEKTFTDNSSIVLTLRGHSLPTSTTDPTGDERRRSIAQVRMPGSDEITPEPTLWEGFRAVACGLADASPLPTGIDAPARGSTRLLVTAPDLIAPESDRALSFSDPALPDVAVLTCDAFGASELRQLLEGALASGSADESTEEIVDQSSATSGAVPPAPQHVPDGVTPTSGSGLQGLSRSELQRLLGKLEEWTSARFRSSSFAWRVGAAIGVAIESASTELADAITRIGAGEPRVDVSAQEKESHRFTRFLRVGLLVLLLLVLGVAGMAITGLLSFVVALVAIVIIILVSFGGAFTRFTRFASSQARAEFERNRQIDGYWFAFTRAYEATSAVTRCCALYRQYVDWAQTCAHLIREPWGHVEHARVGGVLDDVAHPLSMIIGRAQLPPDQFQRSVAAAQQIVITPGWLRGAFDWNVRASGQRYRMLMNTPDDADSDPKLDTSMIGTVAGTHAATGETIYRPRGQVEADAEQHRFGAELRAVRAEEIVEATLRHVLGDLFSDVEVPPPAGRGRTGDGLMEFLSYIVPTETAQPSSFPGALFRIEELRAPEIIEVTLPASVTIGSAPLSEVSRKKGNWRAEYGRPFLVGAHRVDLSPVLRPDELQLVSPEMSDDHESPRADDGSRPAIP